MTKDEILAELKVISEENGVELTENAEKIASFRERMGVGLHKCVCDPKNPKRWCISETCMRDIKGKGICHCRCFQKHV